MTRSRGVVALVVLLALAAAGPGLAGADGHEMRPAVLQTSGVETDAVVLNADVQENGSAVWTIEYRVRLDDENATTAFQSLERDVANNTTAYERQFADRMSQTVGAAASATGREMAISNVSVSARTTYFGKRYGVVSYQFVWEGFAETDGDRLIIGDSLAGFFLDEGTRLTISWPEDYERRAVSPPPDDSNERSVTWVGPTEFATGEPQVVAAPASPLPVSPSLVLPVLVLVVAVLGGGVWYRRRETVGRAGGTGGTSGTGGESPAAPGAGRTADSDGDRGGGAGDVGTTTGETGGGVATGAGAGGRTANTGDAATDGDDSTLGATADDEDSAGVAETPEELLSPEERVMRLLHDRGGRMKQKRVTEEFEWSAARTSQVVGNLRDDGEVESFRLGRENVLKLPDDEDDA